MAGAHDGAVTAYLGIPFAAPPVGALRWQAPAAPSAWSGTRKAHAFAPNCQQEPPNGPFRAWTEEYLAGDASMALARDAGLASMHAWARARLADSRQPVYAYLWTHTEPGPRSAQYRAFHSSELPYVFGTLDTAPRPFTAQDRALSRQVQRYWVNWIRSGNPNGAGLPAWPRLDPAAPRIMALAASSAARPLLEPRKLSLFERHIASGGRPGLF